MTKWASIVVYLFMTVHAYANEPTIIELKSAILEEERTKAAEKTLESINRGIGVRISASGNAVAKGDECLIQKGESKCEKDLIVVTENNDSSGNL